MNLPSSVKHLHGSLYLVPFDLIYVPDKDMDKKDYDFHNPRSITEKGQEDLNDPKLSLVLREDIKNRGLMAPLVCRYIPSKKKMQIVGGDRRYRALSYLIESQEMVCDTSSIVEDKGNLQYGWRMASHVYEHIPCQIYMTDSEIDALAYSYAENHCRVNFHDGHDVALFMEIRRHGASDDSILQVLQKNKLWLQDIEELVSMLDGSTLLSLCEGQITMDAARKLASIENSDVRHKVLDSATKITDKKNNEKSDVNKRRMQRATKQLDFAEVELQMANVNQNEQEISDAQESITNAKVVVVDADIKQRERISATTGRDVDVAMSRHNLRQPADKKRSNPTSRLSKQYLDCLASLLNNNCTFNDADGVFSIPEKLKKNDVVNAIIGVVKAINNGESDCRRAISRIFGSE